MGLGTTARHQPIRIAAQKDRNVAQARIGQQALMAEIGVAQQQNRGRLTGQQGSIQSGIGKPTEVVDVRIGGPVGDQQT